MAESELDPIPPAEEPSAAGEIPAAPATVPDSNMGWSRRLLRQLGRISDKARWHAARDRISRGTHGGAYFEVWRAEIAQLDPGDEKNLRLQTRMASLWKDYLADKLTWCDLNGIVRATLPRLSLGRVDALRCSSRTYYYQRSRPAYVADYDRSSPPALNALASATLDEKGNPPPALEQAIRDDAIRLHDEITRIEIYRPYQEEKRSEITLHLTIALVVVLGGLGLVALAFLWSAHFVPVIPVVMAAGALGAAVSSQRRLQDSFDEDASILNITKYLRVPIGVLLAPVIGAIFALILLLVLTADIMPADLLPNLGDQPPASTPPISPPVTTATACGPWTALIAGPACQAEYAKLMVYAFLAGFAERLVPDTLDRLTSRSG